MGGASQVMNDFCGWTSAHGLPHIGGSTSTVLKVFWGIVTFVSAVIFVYQMYTLVDKYIHYHTSIQTQLKFEKRQFPAVTICPLNPVMKSILHHDSGYINVSESFIEERMLHPHDDALEHEAALHAQDQTKMLNFNYELHLGNEAAPDILGSNMTMQDYEYKEDDLFLSCAYNTKDCLDGDFVRYFDASYGVCYTFNKAKETLNRTDYYDSTRAGPLYGLRVVVRVHQDDYLPFIPAAGVRVVIHNQNSEPFIDAFGFNSAPGFANAYGIRYVRTSRLGLPYGICQQDIHDPSHYYFSGNYTAEGCYRSCLQNAIYDECHCYDPTLGHAAHEHLADSCSAGSLDLMKEHTDCQNGVKKEFNGIDACECPLACFEESYNVVISTAMWPSEPPDCNKRNLTKRYWGSIDKCRDWYKLNTAMVECFYQVLNYQVVVEVSDYNWLLFVAEAGGQAGLFLGVSFITCVEFISIGCVMVMYCANKDKMPNETPDSADSGSSEESGDSDDDSDEEEDNIYGTADADDDGQPPPIAD